MGESSGSFPHPMYERTVLQPFFRDAQTYYYAPMLAANRAHVVMLAEQNIISRENARALLDALQEVETLGLEGLGYQSGVEDLFFTVENALIERAGPAYGGNLQLARSRNDLGYALTRLALRPLLLDVLRDLKALRQALHGLASQHLETIMPGYTHTQPAQPTTLAHYLTGFLSTLERDGQRLENAYRTNNQSPLGAAAFTGTGLPIDRQRLAALLGFEGVMGSTYDSIAASDNLTEIAGALSTLAVNLSRFTHDMLIWARRENGALRIDDSFIQISSIMPQKRNPVVLEHLRARFSRLLSYAQGVLLQCHNIPYGDTQDIEDEIFPVLMGSLHTASDGLQLYAAVIQTLHVNVEQLREQAGQGFTVVTEIADTLVREAGLAFRQAHSVVSGMVSHALEHHLSPQDLTLDLLQSIAQARLGRTLHLSEEAFQRALDVEHFVRVRTVTGGAAPEATREPLAHVQAMLDRTAQAITQFQKAMSSADQALQDASAEI